MSTDLDHGGRWTSLRRQIIPGNSRVRVRYRLRLDRLGPGDGSAIGAIIEDCAEAVVEDGAALRTNLRAGDALPVSVALWRKLHGFPAGARTGASASSPCWARSSTSPTPAGKATLSPSPRAAASSGNWKWR